LKAWRSDDDLFDGGGVDLLLGGRGSDALGSEDSAGGDTFGGSRGHDECNGDADDIVANCER
ncbi:MAG: hypothetical protein M3Q18_04685, partial [Actinomycetota bacterium]|nr:hypothetical protein [Actinomycetota bacterium]